MTSYKYADSVPGRIRVLIVDESAVVRKTLKQMLQNEPDFEVVGSAIDPYMARDKIKALEPDVLTLAIRMPRMDGLTFLSNLMRLHPIPVVMVSSLTVDGADETRQALAMGAVDYVTKPTHDLAVSLQKQGDEIVRKLRDAVNVKVQKLSSGLLKGIHTEKKYSADVIIKKQEGYKHCVATEPIVAVGASTGGTEAIKDFLLALPADVPPIVITQHIPVAFSGKFANRMDGVSALNVCEASHGQKVLPGHVYIAPGDRHLLIKRDGLHYYCELNNGLPVNRHKPSVDVLFRSAAQAAGGNAVGILLTGMGDDGAVGLKELKEAGAVTIAQDKTSSLIWGMPGAAVRLGAATYILPLSKIANALKIHLKNREK